MLSDTQIKDFIKFIGFIPKENATNIFCKQYSNHSNHIIEIDFSKKNIDYGSAIRAENKASQNFLQDENWVVLECVDRLLEKGYSPQNIILEKTWAAGHGTSGRLDICVTRTEDDKEYLLIECKTYGKEFDLALKKLNKDGGQLFTYFKFSNNADVLMLYTSKLGKLQIDYQNAIINIEDDYRNGDVKDFYDKWNKLTSENGIFENWVTPYNFQSKSLTIDMLQDIKQEDSSFIFNRFLEILRHNVVSDKPNAFNKIFTLFLCKIYDEKINEGTDNELSFQWRYGVDDDESFQLRLTDLYREGMKEFLDKDVTDFTNEEFEKKYRALDDDVKESLRKTFNKIRLEKNNEFAIKEVYDHKSFKENAKVVKEVVELLQRYKIRYAKKQQYLSDFFELLLTTGLKQESGQFFTPVPIAQFIIKSLPIDSIVKTKINTNKKDDLLPYIIDYASGSGHFLTESMHVIQKLINKTDSDKLHGESKKFIGTAKQNHFDWALQYIYGIEKDYRLVKVGKVGCYLHGDGLANIIHSDGLSNFSDDSFKGKLKHIDKDFPKENKQFDILVSNPPYSVSAFKGASREYYTEGDFELYNYLTDNSSEIESLFIERAKQLLKDGGVAGIILPSSILSNAGIYAKCREIILQYFEIIAITVLGSNTFMATGTNTVVLFMRRRNNYESSYIKNILENFFTNHHDITINGVETPVAKYLDYVWESISFDDYISLIKKEPNETIKEHEIYQDYLNKLKAKNDEEFFKKLIEIEFDKLFYFILAYHQKLVIVSSGEKDAEKRFIGYEFSNRRGSEGIHPIQRGKTIEECTQLFDIDSFDNPKKASTYIYKAFSGDFDTAIDETMSNNVFRARLIDLMSFERIDFDKSISTNVKKKISIESKWSFVRIGDIATAQYGYTDKATDNGTFRYLRITDIMDDGSINLHNDMKYVTPDEDVRKQFLLYDNDIVVARSGSVGKAAIYKTNKYNDMIFASYLIRLKVDNNRVLPEYLFNYTKTEHYWMQVKADATVTSQPNLNAEKIKNLKVPLPPLHIQQKIVDEIEKIENEQQEVKSLIDRLYGEIETLINSGNIVHKLKDVIFEINPSKKKIISSYANDTNVSFIEMADVSNDGKIINIQEKMLGEVKKGYTFFQVNDVLVAKITPCMENGKGALVPELSNNIGFGSTEFFVLRANLDKIYPLILYYITQSKIFRKNAAKNMTGTSGHKRVPKSFIENYEVKIPSIREQGIIISQIGNIEKQITVMQSKLSGLNLKKESVLSKYL